MYNNLGVKLILKCDYWESIAYLNQLLKLLNIFFLIFIVLRFEKIYKKLTIHRITHYTMIYY